MSDAEQLAEAQVHCLAHVNKPMIAIFDRVHGEVRLHCSKCKILVFSVRVRPQGCVCLSPSQRAKAEGTSN